MAPGCFGGIRTQRRFTYMLKRAVWRRAEQSIFPQKIKMEIYGWASEKRDWFVTRKTASSSSPPPTGFRRELFITCSSIAKGGSGFCPVGADLLALTIRRRNVRQSYRTQSPKGFRVTKCRALPKIGGAAFT